MAKQIQISQNDHGIIFEAEIVDKDKNPINLETDNIKFWVTTPSRKDLPIEDIKVVDAAKGKVEFEILGEHTKEVGEHMIFIELSSLTHEVTSVEAATYEVIRERRGI